MEIRKTRECNIDRVMEIFEGARRYMQSVGNPNQWGSLHPLRSSIERDVALGQSYVVVDGRGEIIATFALVFGDDPTYSVVYGGSWPTSTPYATIHRIASSGERSGIGNLCFSWSRELCRERGYNLRFDTHQDNQGMQAIAERFGFIYCGIIHLASGAERLAYHLEVKSE